MTAEIVQLGRAPEPKFSVGDRVINAETKLTGTITERRFDRMGRGWIYILQFTGGGVGWFLPEGKLQHFEAQTQSTGGDAA